MTPSPTSAGPSEPEGERGPPPGPRARAMSGSVLSAAEGLGVTPHGCALLHAALERAMAYRAPRLLDEHDPTYLHPGRTVLLMLREGGARDGVVLATGALLESRDRALRTPPREVADLAGGAVRDTLESLPGAGEGRLERLLRLESEVLVAVLSERLDHLRHEHLREPVVPWPELLDETRRVWHPLATRTAPELARRFAHWLRVFERRIPPSAGASGRVASP